MDLLTVKIITFTILAQRPFCGANLNIRPALECAEPENLDLLKAVLNTQPKHESFLNIPPERETPMGSLRLLDEIRNQSPEYVSIVLEPEFGRISCPTHVRHHRDQMRTTCPWYYERNTDPNRYPRTIIQAKCSCERCLDFLDGIRTQNQCKPVPNYIRVLRRVGCSSGYYQYAMALEPMPTGCTCTSLTVRHSHQPRGHGMRPDH